jgi:hypothetical protein
MSRHDPKPKNRLPPFVPLLIDTMDSPAWRAMSHGARSLYVALKRRYNVNFHNNGKLFLSQRMAAKETGSHHNEIARWFRELQHYGFIVMVTPGALGVEGKGKAPRWRLTELGLRVGGEPEYPTRDFLHWGGNKFKDKKTKSRAGNGARRVREKAHTTVPESRPQKTPSVPETPHIQTGENVREKAHRSNLPSPGISHPSDARPARPRYRLLPVSSGPPLDTQVAPDGGAKATGPLGPARVRPRMLLNDPKHKFVIPGED